MESMTFAIMKQLQAFFFMHCNCFNAKITASLHLYSMCSLVVLEVRIVGIVSKETGAASVGNCSTIHWNNQTN